MEICHKIPVCVDTGSFKPLNKVALRKSLGYSSEEKIAIYVGRLGKVKGLNLLLEAFRLLIQNSSAWRLLLAGEGKEKQNLMKRAKDLAIKDKVIFLGQINHGQLPELLNCADIFVLTSYAEGVPISLLEAMACGLPVVATKVGGIGEVIQDGINGLLVENRDPQLLAFKINEALEKKEYLRENALVTIKRQFSAKVVVHEIQKVLEEVYDSKKE